MILFFLKKNFCDGWDNLLYLFVTNIVILACALGTFFAAGALSSIVLLSIAVIAAGSAVTMIPVFAASACSAKIAAFKAVSLKDFFVSMKDVWKTAMLFGAAVSLIVILFSVGFPFYMRLGSLFGLFFAAVIFWAVAIAVLSLQWFMPLYSQMGGGFLKTMRKCFIVFFDNSGFSLFMFFHSLIVFIVSIIMFLTAPGISGIVLGYNNALRLRLYKYDWLEEHPELTPREARRQIPWGELIAEDKDILGPRNFRSFLFPWK